MIRKLVGSVLIASPLIAYITAMVVAEGLATALVQVCIAGLIVLTVFIGCLLVFE